MSLTRTVFSNGIEIAFEVIGEGSPLVLLSGYLGTSQTWKQLGYTRLLDRYQLILIDQRGYGKSTKPHDPGAYHPKAKAEDVIAVLDALHISQTDIMGFSGGGRTVFALTVYFPKRVRRAAVVGMSPYMIPKEYKLEERLHLLDKGMLAVLNDFERKYGPQPRQVKDQILQMDALAIRADTLAVLTSEGFASDLPFISTPMLLICGSLDPFHFQCTRAVNAISNCQFLTLEQLGHIETLLRKDLVVPHLEQFLKK